MEERLFSPLSEFLNSWNPSPEEAALLIKNCSTNLKTEEILRDTDSIEKGSRMGYLFEAFVKSVILIYSRENLFFSEFDSSRLKEIKGARVHLNDLGNITAIGQDCAIITELDALYEFNEYGISTPIVFEIKYGNTNKVKPKKKRRLLSIIYDDETAQNSYICKVAMAKEGQKSGLYHTEKNLRLNMIVPSRDLGEVLCAYQKLF